MATFTDLATDALTDLGVIAAGETPETDDITNALRAMNRLLDQWAAERLNIYTVTATDWSIVSGTQTYSVGAGATVNIPRPIYIDHITFKYTPATIPIELPMQKLTDDEWAAQPIKTLTSTLPQAFYYNPTYPLGTLKLWPIPTNPPSALTGTLYAPQQVGEFAAVTTVVSLPPGYRRMIVKNLAVEMAPSYQRNLPQELRDAAVDAKSVVKRSNVHMTDMLFESGALGSAVPHTYYIRSGE